MRNTEERALTPSWAFLAFVITFIIYGSLFPFDFREAPESFDSLLSQYFIFSNTADAIDNLLLFIPLGFALRQCYRKARVLLIVSVLAILTLGFGLQIIQLYLPSRTASLADVFWNSMGLCVGLVFAGFARKLFLSRLSTSRTFDPYALLLLSLWFLYEAFPFVPTLDYGLLRDHVKTIVMAPPFETVRFVQHLLAAMLGGIALQRSRVTRHEGTAVVFVWICAVLMEIFVAYGSLRRETLLGMSTGLATGFLFSRLGEKPAWFALTTASSCAYLITVFTPYRGQIADAGFTFTPFSSFLWHSVTRDLPPIAFEALAVGSLMWASNFWLGTTLRRHVLWLSGVLLTIVALEAIRVLVAGYHGDTTSLLVTALLASFALASIDLKGIPPIGMATLHTPQLMQHQPAGSSLPAGHTYVISVLLLAVAIYVLARFPGMPYNIRELVPSGLDGIGAAICLSAALCLAVNSPLLLLRPDSRRWFVLFPIMLLLQGVIIWCLLRIGVPLESIHDIIGSPIHGWPWDWEMSLRFLALHQAIATQMIGATFLVAVLCRPSLLASLIYWLIVSLMFAWPLHFVVVEWAATDNLTELMRDNASFKSSTLLACGIFFFFISSSAFAAAIAFPPRRLMLLATALLAAPLATLCFMGGTEPVIIKYGKAFSAAQFLLSSDRNYYLQEADLLSRFTMAYVLVSAFIAALQIMSWHMCIKTKQLLDKVKKTRSLV